MSSRIEVSDDEETCLFKKEYQNNQDLEDSDNSDPEEDNLIMGSDEESDSNEEPEEQTFQVSRLLEVQICDVQVNLFT